MLIPEYRLCACGCGLTFKVPHRAPNRIYKRGHGQRTDQPNFLDAICANCQQPIRIHPSRKRFQHNFCSRTCSSTHNANRALIEFTCEWCKKSFMQVKSRKQGKRIFCSSECFYRAYKHQPDSKVSVPCSYCGIILEIHPSSKKRNKHFYCSKDCRRLHIIGINNPAYTSGNGRPSKYGVNWKSQRRLALRRDDFKCQYCNKQPERRNHLHVHHVVPFYKFDGDWKTANALSNLITLCITCHRKAELGRISIQTKCF